MRYPFSSPLHLLLLVDGILLGEVLGVDHKARAGDLSSGMIALRTQSLLSGDHMWP